MAGHHRPPQVPGPAPCPQPPRRADRLPDESHRAPEEADDGLALALARLPAKQRHAVAYHYLGGLPYAEVAALLGGGADAARRAAADGIATLRRTYPTHRIGGTG